LGEALVLQGNLAVRKGDVAGARALLGEAEGYLPAENLLYRGIRCLALGRAYYLAGEVEAAGQQLAEAIGMSEAVGNVTGLLLATTFLGDVRRMEGKLHEAAVCYGEAMRIADEKRHWQVIGALIGLGQLAYEWNDLAAAQQRLEQAIALGTQAERLVETSYLPAGYRALARVLWARGERQAALAALDAALALSVREQRGDLSLWIEAERSRLAWQAGARVPGEREELEAVEMQPVYAEPVALVEARWLVAAGQAPAALALLARLLAGARAAGRMGIVLEGLVVQALAEQARGARTAALRSLGEALALAEPQGYVRLFVDEGATLRALLAQGAAAGELPAYGQRLPAAMAHGRGQGAAGGAVVEPLTPREWEVARLVAAGLSNQEIAATLVISYATVKRHINSLFGKLGVQSRAQAILKLQELEG
jgi:LuxR family maltose regulon positive regulatory protein